MLRNPPKDSIPHGQIPYNCATLIAIAQPHLGHPFREFVAATRFNQLIQLIVATPRTNFRRKSSIAFLLLQKSIRYTQPGITTATRMLLTRDVFPSNGILRIGANSDGITTIAEEEPRVGSRASTAIDPHRDGVDPPGSSADPTE